MNAKNNPQIIKLAYQLNNKTHNCWTSRLKGGVEFEWITREITRKRRKKRLEIILGNRRDVEEAWCRKSKNAQREGKKVEVVEYLFSYHASITY